MLKDVDLSSMQLELGKEGEVESLEGAEALRWGVHGVLPRLLCTPRTPEALASALLRCDERKAAVIPWGGGTQQRLGAAPQEADVVLVTRGVNRLVEYEPGDLTVTAEAGMRLSELQKILAENGQWLPLDPMVNGDATLGGLVATNASGPRRMKDGGLRDLVIGTRVAGVDGNVTRAGGRVVKNVTGYDLNKAHIGALGTLGVVVEVTFKVAPRPETERSWLGSFPTAELAGRAITELLRRPVTPTALDLLNEDAAQRMGISVQPGRWLLLARASGFRQAVARHLSEFDRAARVAGAVEVDSLSEAEATSLWAAYDEKAAGLRWTLDVLTCRFAVPPSAVGLVSEKAAAIREDAAVWSHGSGAVFWSIDAQDLAAVEMLRGLAETAGGSLVVENWAAPAEVDVWGPPAGPLRLMQALKAQYDPNGILNPGRFVGGI